MKPITLDNVINAIENPPTCVREAHPEQISVEQAALLRSKSNQLLPTKSYSALDCLMNNFRLEVVDPDTKETKIYNPDGMRVSVLGKNEGCLTSSLNDKDKEKQLEDILQIIITSQDSFSPQTLWDFAKITTRQTFAECFGYGKKRLEELCAQGKIHCINNLDLVYSSSFNKRKI